MVEMEGMAERVRVAFAECCTKDGDIEVESMIGPGKDGPEVGTVRFDSVKIKDHGEEIAALLMELPDEYRESGGGGWSFLNACMDRHGDQWTGMHVTMAQLFALGLAAGMVASVLPRDMWDVLPGGMPYYVVKDRSFVGPKAGAQSNDPEGVGNG